MWEPRRLTTLWACYSDSFTFFFCLASLKEEEIADTYFGEQKNILAGRTKPTGGPRATSWKALV
jgi:hypothetical protein